MGPEGPILIDAGLEWNISAAEVLGGREKDINGQIEDAVEASRVLTMDEISTLAQNGGKPAETLMNVCALIARRFRTDVCCVYLLEPDRNNLVLAASLGLRPQCIGTLRMATHEGLVGLVAEQLLPVAAEQVKNHPRFKYFSEAGEDDFQSFLEFPSSTRVCW